MWNIVKSKIFFGLIVENKCIEVVRWNPELAKKCGSTSEPQLHDFSAVVEGLINPDKDFYEIKKVQITWL